LKVSFLKLFVETSTLILVKLAIKYRELKFYS